MCLATARRSGLSVLLARDSSVGLDVECMVPLPDEAVILSRSRPGRRPTLDLWNDLQLLHSPPFPPRRAGSSASAAAPANASRAVQRNCLQCGFLFIDASGAKFCSPVCGNLHQDRDLY